MNTAKDGDDERVEICEIATTAIRSDVQAVVKDMRVSMKIINGSATPGPRGKTTQNDYEKNAAVPLLSLQYPELTDE